MLKRFLIFIILGLYCTVGTLAIGETIAKRQPPTPADEGKTCLTAVIVVIGDVSFRFRWCPPGTFMMGSSPSEAGRQPKIYPDAEAAFAAAAFEDSAAALLAAPKDINNYCTDDEMQHRVTLTKGFWMLETEVTQEQWRAVMGSYPPDVPGQPEGNPLALPEDLPVSNVSWVDCQTFCKKCTDLGLPIQLPTEAQWEYACRAGTTGPFAGDLDEMAWYRKNSNETTHPVGMKSPNAWGLYDMYGNVNEWCADRFGTYSWNSVTDPTGPDSDQRCILRGGHAFNDALECRSASRNAYRYDSYDLLGFSGFRVILSPDCVGIKPFGSQGEGQTTD